MNKFASLLALLTVTSYSFAKDCSFRKLEITKREGTTGFYKISDKITLELLEGVEGPAWITLNGKRNCKIEGGNFSDFYISASKFYLMTSEYSGSCGENRIIDIKTCKGHSVKAEYCGSAEVVNGNKVVNKPACEPTEKDRAYCTSAKVYTITGTDCKMKLDEKASKALTKKELGVELPFDKGMTVPYPKK
ncbi:hypothetical protein ACJVC5_11280 [Peredibacter sp. HCB2-198]|uniref:hypothetical protein n=1 Tax=Peredibacter sp. HCB2-198 TaxID=3383025 RepID=UPI0038B4C818